MESKVVEGLDGYLFLGGWDRNDVMNQIDGKISASHNDMVVWSYNINNRKKLASQYGFKAINVFCPEPHVFNQKFLPLGTYVSEYRPITLLTALFKDDVLYPLAQMEAQRGQIANEYPKMDSHWGQVGAYTAYCLVMDKLGLSRQTVALDRCEVVERGTSGDLGNKMSPEVFGTEYDLNIKDASATLVYSNWLENHGHIQRYLNKNRSGKILIFGTSFSTMWMKFFAESFAELVYIYSTTTDEYLLELFRPDYVVYEVPERFALSTQSDAIKYSSFYAYLAKRASKGSAVHYYETDDPFIQKLQSVYQCIDSEGAAPCPDSPIDIAAVWSFLKMDDNNAMLLRDSTFSVDANQKFYDYVDNKKIDITRLHSLPATNAVMLATIRALMVDGLLVDAFEMVKHYRSVYGWSVDIDYYAQHLDSTDDFPRD